jgi:prepilin-type processing-associated H-X9-DG protein
MRQPGGWLFNILPYMEQSGLYMLQAGKSGSPLAAAGSTLMATPVSAFYCPSRRQAKAYPQLSHKDTSEGYTYDAGVSCMGDSCNERVCDQSAAYATAANYARSEVSAMSDYAGNCYGYLGGDPNWGANRTYQMDAATLSDKTALAKLLKWRDSQADNYIYPGTDGYTDGCGKGGIFYPYSTVEVQDVKDGTSNTILAGEKYLVPDHYEDGKDHGDCWCCWIGYDGTNCRGVQWAGTPHPPRRDTPGAYPDMSFGSCHAGGANFTMCDGSVRQISYGIDNTVFIYLGHRGDGHAIDATSLSF